MTVGGKNLPTLFIMHVKAKFSFPELNRNAEWEFLLLTFPSLVFTPLGSKPHSPSLSACLDIKRQCNFIPSEKF